MANKFLLYPVDHWCERPKNYQHISVKNWLNISSPILSNGDFDRCNMFDIDYMNIVSERPKENTYTIPCTNWEYNEEIFQVLKYFTLLNVTYLLRQFKYTRVFI